MIQKDVRAMSSKGVCTFLLILDKKQLINKISKERRIAIAGVR